MARLAVFVVLIFVLGALYFYGPPAFLGDVGTTFYLFLNRLIVAAFTLIQGLIGTLFNTGAALLNG